MVPGVIINHIPAASRQYIGSPGIAVLASGAYVVSHDVFGPGSTNSRTEMFVSENHGVAWQRLSEIEGQFWSSLFFYKGALYLIGTSQLYGHTIIRRSEDGGATWTTPKDRGTGLLLDDGQYHCAPVPVVVHAGRVWRGMEDAMGPGGWGSHFRAFTMSAPEDSDLLHADSWTCSTRLARDPKWLDGHFGGWLEGNAVVSPTGLIVDVLRVDCRHGSSEKAAVVKVSEDGSSASFDPETGFIDFPGGGKKFSIRHDPLSGHYWSLSNYCPNPNEGSLGLEARNTLALVSSRDLRSWEVRSLVLHHDDDSNHAFQYVDWLFEEDDVIAVSRTAFDDEQGGAHNYHDANYLTFHRIENFTTLGSAVATDELPGAPS